MKLTDDQVGFILYRTFYIENRLIVTPWEHLDEGVKERWVATGQEIRLMLEATQWSLPPPGLEEVLREYPGEEGAPS